MESNRPDLIPIEIDGKIIYISQQFNGNFLRPGDMYIAREGGLSSSANENWKMLTCLQIVNEKIIPIGGDLPIDAVWCYKVLAID